jgi:hypothetical protein
MVVPTHTLHLEDHHYAALNAEMAKQSPNIVEKQGALQGD